MALIYAGLFKGSPKKVLGVAKNYLAPGETPPAAPVVFMKPLSSIITCTTPIPLPEGMEVKYECNHYVVELGVMIGRKGKNIRESKASKYIGGYCFALDLTAANLVAEARKAGLPWTISKGYDGALPLTPFIDAEVFPDPHDNILFQLKVNDEVKQNGNTADMHFKVPFLISYLSQFFTLNKGDLILTGTPAGSGLLKSKDKLHVHCEKEEQRMFFCDFRVV